jgi:hypothetical protein
MRVAFVAELVIHAIGAGARLPLPARDCQAPAQYPHAGALCGPY